MATFSHPPLHTKFAILHAQLLEEKHFSAAVTLGAVAQQVAYNTNDAGLKHLARTFFDVAFLEWTERREPSTQPVCSFCGRGEPEVRLIAGGKAFICDEDAERIVSIFRSDR